jgi:hypothetical protein
MNYSQYNSNRGILPREGPFPSIVSQKWREDMGYALRKYVEHLRGEGYLEHVVAFEVSGLATEEWYHWSSNRQELAGYSAVTEAAFQDWLREQYGDDVGALRSAWGDGSVTFDTAQVPSRAERLDGVGSLTWRFDGSGDLRRNVVDWYQFYNEIVPDTIDYFAGVLKEATHGTKAVGGFYAYMYEFQASPEFGHNALEQFNESENLDYVYVTASYMNRSLGGGDQYRGPAYSTQLHDKLWFSSDDTATVRTKDIAEHYSWDWLINSLPLLGYTDTIEKNRWQLRRAAGFITCNGMYKAFFDLHATDFAGYYDHPDLMDEVQYENDFFERSANYDRSSNSEILIVSDEFSCNFVPVSWANWNNNLLYFSLTDVQPALIQIGAPADHVLLNDLDRIDADRYKLVVFMNCWHMDDAQRALVEDLKGSDRVLVFCYAPGYFNGSGYSEANMESITGMGLSVGASTLRSARVTVTGDHSLGQSMQSAGVGTFGPSNSICQRIWVDDGSATRLGYDPYSSSHDVMAIKDMGDWKSIYCVTSDMPAKVYRELAAYAGVHIYNEQDDTLYANSSYVCIHPSSAGSRTIEWPEAVDVYDALAEGSSLATNTTSYTRSYQQGETKIYRYESAQ